MKCGFAQNKCLSTKLEMLMIVGKFRFFGKSSRFFSSCCFLLAMESQKMEKQHLAFLVDQLSRLLAFPHLYQDEEKVIRKFRSKINYRGCTLVTRFPDKYRSCPKISKKSDN